MIDESWKSEADLLANTKKERKFTIHLDVWEFRMSLFLGPLPKEKKNQSTMNSIYFYQRATHKWGHPLGGRGSARRWRYSISLFSKMGEEGGGRGRKSQKIGDVIYG